MKIAVPREVKDNEYRVAMTPAGVNALVEAGHSVLVESSAGANSGFSDAAYRRAGAEIADTNAAAFTKADLVVKVKEPLTEEYELLGAERALFTYLHLAPNEPLTRALVDRRVTGIGYETVQAADGALPLLLPMS